MEAVTGNIVDLVPKTGLSEASAQTPEGVRKGMRWTSGVRGRTLQAKDSESEVCQSVLGEAWRK